MVLGYLLARIVICALFLPQYFRGEMFTAYELMRRRFGERIRKLTAAIFLVTRALAEGVRVFAVSLVVSIVLGTGEMASIVLIVLLTLFYTFEGGMTAVIWTDVVQMSLYVVRRRAQLRRDPGKDSGRLAARGGGGGRGPQVRDLRFSLRSHDGVLCAPVHILGGRGGRLLPDHRQPRHRSAHGAAAAQRAQRARTAAQRCWQAGHVVAFQFTLFLLIGVLLWVYYGDLGDDRASRRSTDLSRNSSGTTCRRGWPAWRSRQSWRRPWPI